MKTSTKNLLLLIACLLQLTIAFAQAPQKMTFQSVIRNSSGALVVSSTVGMQMSILRDSVTGPAVYVERQFPVTNSNGLATILIGTGTVMSGSFDSINWGTGTYYLLAETDPTGGTSYTISATQQLVSVPYSFYSNYALHSGDTIVGVRPTVATDAVTSVSYTTVTCHGNLILTGGEIIIFRGVCVATDSTPTVDNSYVTPGGSLGAYSVNVSGLTPNTLYYVRAFATTVHGTSYGSSASFTTLPLAAPTVATDSITGITNTSANGIGSVTSDGGSPVTARGICWNMTGSPTIADATAPSGTGTGDFYTTLSSLSTTTTYYARAYATNAIGTSYGAQDTFITIVTSLATLTTDAVTSIYAGSAVSGVNVSSAGGSAISAQGICWGMGPYPTTDSATSYISTGLGDYPATLTGLSPATTYYVRAFCMNSTGIAYGAQNTFTTLSLSLPVLTTNSIIGITAVSATSGGNISYDGGSPVTAYGVCWSTSGTPTVDSSHTTDGTGTGFYNSNITSLSPSTTYYVCAYATNSLGTAYGSVISFTTDSLVPVLPALPIVATDYVTLSTTGTTAATGGYVLSAVGSSVTAYGVCWGTSSLPDLTGSHTIDGSGLGFFSSTITGLSGCGTVYYVRAYATDSLGTGYGSVNTVSTGIVLTITDSAVTTVTTTTAVAIGNVTSDGGCAVTQRGFVWVPAGISGSPTLGGGYTTAVTVGSGTGTYTATLSGLHVDCAYNVCSYATNSIGTVYGPVQTFTTLAPSSGHYLGEYYAGGYIFYLDSTGVHGMVCASGPIGSSDWGCDYTYCSGTSSAFGSGASNTAAIIAACGTYSAAGMCAGYSFGGYIDWFFPSYDEFDLMWSNLAVYGYCGLAADGYYRCHYWTSTEQDSENAADYPTDFFTQKLWSQYIVPARRF